MSTTEWPVVAATGHRFKAFKGMPDDVLPWVKDELDRVAVKLRDEHGTEEGVTGMALCVDHMWGWAVKRAGLRLHAEVPYRQQADRWTKAQKREWQELLTVVDSKHYVGDLNDPGAQAAVLLHKRNDLMLSRAQAVVAVWRSTRTDGGTYTAVQKAVRAGLPVIHIDPDRRTTSLPSRDRLRELLWVRQ